MKGASSQSSPNYLSAPSSRSLSGHSDKIYTLSVLPNGNYVSGGKDGMIKIWDSTTDKLLQTIQADAGIIYALFALSNRRLASGHESGVIKIWDLDTGSCLRMLSGHSNQISSLSSLSNGYLVSGSFDYSIKIWNPHTGECISTFLDTTYIDSLTVFPNDNIVSGNFDGSIKIWDSNTGALISILKKHNSRVFALTVLSNGYLVSGDRLSNIMIWNPGNRPQYVGTIERAFYYSFIAHSSHHSIPSPTTIFDQINMLTRVYGGGIRALATLSKKYIVSGSWNSINIFDFNTGQCLHSLTDYQGSIYALAVLQDGSFIVGSSDALLRRYRFPQKTPLKNARPVQNEFTPIKITPIENKTDSEAKIIYQRKELEELVSRVIQKNLLLHKDHAIEQVTLQLTTEKTIQVKNWRAIHFALFHYDLLRFNALVELQVSMKPTVNGDSPLHALFLSPFANHKLFSLRDIIITLLQKGVDINFQNEFGETALNLAIKQGYPRAVIESLVMNGAAVDLLTEQNQTPWQIARSLGYAEISEYLKQELLLSQVNTLAPTVWPEVYEYALLSEHVYRLDITINSRVELSRDSGDNIKLDQWQVWDIHENTESGYYGVSYFNGVTGHLVLVHRGSEFYLEDILKNDKDVQADLEGVYSGKLTAQIFHLQKATQKALEHAVKLHVKFSIAGHSLAAWEAVVSAIYAYRKFNYKYIHAVVFDSPGVARAIELISHKLFPLSERDLKYLSIFYYQSVSNVVNTIGAHLKYAKMFRLYPAIPAIPKRLERFSKISDYHCSLARAASTHPLSVLNTAFNLTTGQPHRLALVKNWPLVDSRSSTGYANSISSAVYFILSSLSVYKGWRLGLYYAYTMPVMMGILISLTDYIYPSLSIRHILRLTPLRVIFQYLIDLDTSQLQQFYKFARQNKQMEPYDNIGSHLYNLNEKAGYSIEENDPRSISVDFEIEQLLPLIKELVMTADEQDERFILFNAYHYDEDMGRLKLTSEEFENFSMFIDEVKVGVREFLKDEDVSTETKQRFANKLRIIKNNLISGFRLDGKNLTSNTTQQKRFTASNSAESIMLPFWLYRSSLLLKLAGDYLNSSGMITSLKNLYFGRQHEANRAPGHIINNDAIGQYHSIKRNFNQTNSFPFDTGRWDTDTYQHPQTGEPIFIYRVYREGIEVGSATFYKHPLFCRSKSGDRHNMIATGILSEVDIDPYLLDEVCDALPPTFSDNIVSGSLSGLKYGALRGFGNVVAYSLNSKGVSRDTANRIGLVTYYGSFFLLRYYEYAVKEEISDWQSALTTLYQAAADTSSLVITSIFINLLSEYCRYLSDLTHQYGFEFLSKLFKNLGNFGHLSIYVYDAYQKNVSEVIAHFTFGVASQYLVEKIGKTTVNKISVIDVSNPVSFWKKPMKTENKKDLCCSDSTQEKVSAFFAHKQK
jgi:WD40 repeat protein